MRLPRQPLLSPELQRSDGSFLHVRTVINHELLSLIGHDHKHLLPSIFAWVVALGNLHLTGVPFQYYMEWNGKWHSHIGSAGDQCGRGCILGMIGDDSCSSPDKLAPFPEAAERLT